jgi:hypothetical protein|tara:strand:+ start:3271 stop:4908 length:1638 start_codon:yes stop_codon:yes gene_type:complete
MAIFVGSNTNDSDIKSDRIGFAVSTTNPGSAAQGDSYFNSGDKQLKVYNGSDWDSVGAGGGTVEAVASGTLSNGQTVILQSDGTVTAVTTVGIAQTSGTASTFQSNTVGLSPQSVVYDSYNKRIVIVFKEGTRGYAVVGTVNANTNIIAFGAITEFESNNGRPYYATFDSTNNRVVIAFNHSTDNDWGKAIVGQVNPDDNSITFGSKAVFNSGITYDVSIAFNPTAGKVVICYRDYSNSNHGTAVVGEVNPSNNAITFGSETSFRGSYSSNTGVAYDSTNDRMVVGFRDEYNTSNRASAVVGTVTGTGITFGSVVRLNPSVSHGYYFTPVHDSNTGKTVILWMDDNNSQKGSAVVGTVDTSNNSISFGNPAIFNNGVTGQMSATFDSNKKQIVVAFQDDSVTPDEPTTGIAGTVSGNTINFGSKIVLDSDDGYWTGIAFDSNANRSVVAFQDADNSNRGRVVIYQQPSESSNVTETNFLGFSDAAYTNGQTAKIQIAGSIDDAQTGLTTGSGHFVQKNGSLGTTADNPSVFAGTALSSTKIIVRK